MRLLELKGDKGMDAIAEIIPVFGRFADSKCVKEFAKKYGNKSMDISLMVKAIFELVPQFFKVNREDVWLVTSIVSGVSLAEIKKYRIFKVLRVLKECAVEMAQDEDVIELFSLSVNTEPGASSVSSQEATEQSDVTE